MPAVVTPRTYMVTLNSKTPGFVWRYEVEALSEELARFAFIQRWAGMMITHDARPSELEVERV